MFAYTVSCTFSDEPTAREWIEWMRREHLAEVLAAGALAAEVVRIDGTDIVLEARYHFANRRAFDAYVRDHAPALRAKGLAAFPPARGVTYARSCGEVLLRPRVRH